MRKSLILVLALAMVFSVAYAPGLSAGSRERYVPSVPSYEKLDPELVKDAEANSKIGRASCWERV